MDYELEASILKLQKDGLRLYGALAEFYFWLGYKKMSDILREKFLRTAEANMETRRRIVADTGEMIGNGKMDRVSYKYPLAGSTKTYRLQWQEGTDEPEDQPNVSNGVDVIPKTTPTEQPWEKGFSGSSGPAPTDKEDRRSMYGASLDRWLAYENDAAALYAKMADQKQDGLYEDLRNEAQAEIERLRRS